MRFEVSSRARVCEKLFVKLISAVCCTCIRVIILRFTQLFIAINVHCVQRAFLQFQLQFNLVAFRLKYFTFNFKSFYFLGFPSCCWLYRYCNVTWYFVSFDFTLSFFFSFFFNRHYLALTWYLFLINNTVTFMYSVSRNVKHSWTLESSLSSF